MKTPDPSRRRKKSGRTGGTRSRVLRSPVAAETSLPSVPATAASPAQPPQVAAGRQRGERPWLWYVAIGSTALFLIIFAVFIFRMMTTIDQQNTQLIASTQAFREMSKRLLETRGELARKDDLLRVLSAPRISIITLQGPRAHRSARGKMFVDPEKRAAILQVSNLPPVPEGKEYQLWVVRGGREVSAGVFAVTLGNSNLFRVDSLPVILPRGVSTIAVTLERKGGAVRPAGEVYLTGSAPI